MGGLGMPEIIIIMVIALIVFGPRKLPELGKTLGKAMNQFRRASEDFKRTWEQEVDLENTRKIATTPTTTHNEPYSSSYDSSYNADAYSYDSNYGYNAPSDAETPVTETATPATETVPVPAQKPVTPSKTQSGQWI